MVSTKCAPGRKVKWSLFSRKGDRLTLTPFSSFSKSSFMSTSFCRVSLLEPEVGAPSAMNARVSATQDKKCSLYIVAGTEVAVSSD